MSNKVISQDAVTSTTTRSGLFVGAAAAQTAARRRPAIQGVFGSVRLCVCVAVVCESLCRATAVALAAPRLDLLMTGLPLSST